MTVEQLLTKASSAVRIEGTDNCREFLERRSHEQTEIQGRVVEEDGRVAYVRNFPTGFKSKRRTISDAELKALAESAGVEWDDDFAGRGLSWTLSDEKVDRDGDIIRQNFDLTAFKNNPVLLDCHAWWKSDAIIGNVVSVTSGKSLRGGPSTEGVLLFATEEMNPLADQLFRMAKANLLRAGSIGFFPKTIIRVEDDDERAELGLGRWGVIFEKSELVEFSMCPVPSNAGAIQQSVRTGLRKGLLHTGDRQTVLNHFKALENKTILDAVESSFNEGSSESVEELRAEVEELTAVVAEATRSLTLAFGEMRKGLNELYENQLALVEHTDSRAAEEPEPAPEEPEAELFSSEELKDLGIDIGIITGKSDDDLEEDEDDLLEDEEDGDEDDDSLFDELDEDDDDDDLEDDD